MNNWEKYVMQKAKAEIYVNNNTATANIPTGSAFTKVVLANSIKGSTKNCDVNLANGEITILKKGSYSVNCTFSSKLGTTDVLFDTAVFVNGEEAPNLHMQRRFSTSGYVFNLALMGELDLVSGDIIDIRVKHNNASAVVITTVYANINIVKN